LQSLLITILCIAVSVKYRQTLSSCIVNL